MVEQNRGHAHRPLKALPRKESIEEVRLTQREQNHRPITFYHDNNGLEGDKGKKIELHQHPFISIFDFHYFALPVQNEELLRKLYSEMNLSSYKISEISDWSRTSISDAIRALKIKRGK